VEIFGFFRAMAKRGFTGLFGFKVLKASNLLERLKKDFKVISIRGELES
jgi:hypothetical protein